MRRRHQLKPDTFPFLAVLLCAMGSLILVLMELDRRARCAANARVEQAWHKTEQDKAELLAHLRTEHEAERQRQLQARETRVATHQAEVRHLHQQAHTAIAERSRVQTQLDDLLRAIQADRALQSNVEKQNEREQQTAEQIERDLTARRDQLDKSRKRIEGSRAEREQLTRDLLLLEATLRRLKELRERAGKTWSVVPYVGKRGLSRRPMYVECDRAGLVFHPERTRIDGDSPSIVKITEEVQRRAREFAAKLPAGEKNREPYWMLLVRPNGIAAYYQFLQAVKPLDAAYGYEFIDAGWDLDFPDPGALPTPVEVATPLPSPVRRADPRFVPVASGRGGMTPAATIARPTFPSRGSPGAELLAPRPEFATGTGPGSAGSRKPGGGTGEATVADGGQAFPVFGGGGEGTLAGTGGTSIRGSGTRSGPVAGVGGKPGGLGTGGATSVEKGAGPPSGVFGGGSDGAFAGPSGTGIGGTGTGSGPGEGGVGKPGGGVGTGGTPITEKVVAPLFPVAGGGGGTSIPGGGAGGGPTSSGNPGADSGTGTGGGGSGTGSGAGSGTAATEAEGGATSTGNHGGGGSPTAGLGVSAAFISGVGAGGGPASGGAGAGGTATANAVGQGNGGTPGSSGKSSSAAGGTELPQPPGAIPSEPGGSTEGEGTAVGSAASGGGGAGSGGSGGAGRGSGLAGGGGAGGGSGGGGGEPGMGGSDGPSSPAPPLKPAPRNGPAEWVIVVDCSPAGVRVSPSRFDIPAANLIPDAGGSVLLRTVQDQIARRRALQRPGEAPVRVGIRFVVHKDGLRVFHLAYPLLDAVVAEKRAVLSSE